MVETATGADMVEGDAGAVMRQVERMAMDVDALADRARDSGNRAVALLARDAGVALLDLLDGLAEAERRAASPTDRTGAWIERRAGR